MAVQPQVVPEAPSAPTHSGNRWKPIAIYCAMAYGISWILWSPLVLGQDGLKWFHISPSIPVFISMGTLGPLIACFCSYRLQTGSWKAVGVLPARKICLIWFVLAPVLVLFCMFGVLPALISKPFLSGWHWHAGVLAGILVPMFNYNLFGGPLFEEFGWRGYLQPQLQRTMPAWIAAIAVGGVWAGWHLPLFLVQGWTSSSPLVFLLIEIGLSMVMAFAWNASGQAIPVAILMHSAFNSSPRFLGEYLGDVSMRTGLSPEMFIALAFLLPGTVLAIATRGRLGVKRA